MATLGEKPAGPKGQYFRANAGLVIMKHGKVLMLERIKIPGSWQFPQGGLDVEEEPVQAAWRELKEETALDQSSCELVAEYPEWVAYELPPEARSKKTGRGQVQRWFVMRFNGDDSAIDLRQGEQGEQEASKFRWVGADEVVALTVGFRKHAYQKVVDFLIQEQLLHR